MHKVTKAAAVRVGLAMADWSAAFVGRKRGGLALGTIGAAALSVSVYLLFWDGKLHELPDKGGVGLLISLLILIVVFKFGASSLIIPVDLF